MASGSRVTAKDLELDQDQDVAYSAPSLKQAREHVEREMIEQALKRNSGKITSAKLLTSVSAANSLRTNRKTRHREKAREHNYQLTSKSSSNMQTKILFRIVTLILAILLVTACSKEARKARLLGEADNYFKAGNYDKASWPISNALRLDPQ